MACSRLFGPLWAPLGPYVRVLVAPPGPLQILAGTRALVGSALVGHGPLMALAGRDLVAPPRALMVRALTTPPAPLWAGP